MGYEMKSSAGRGNSECKDLRRTCLVCLRNSNMASMAGAENKWQNNRR